MISTVQSLKYCQCFQQCDVSRREAGRGWLVSNTLILPCFPGEKNNTNSSVLRFSNKQCLKTISSVKAVNCKAHEEPVLALLHKSLGKTASLRQVEGTSLHPPLLPRTLGKASPR